MGRPPHVTSPIWGSPPACKQALGGHKVKCVYSVQAPVVEKVDSAIPWINLYPVDNAIGFPKTYQLDSDLSGV